MMQTKTKHNGEISDFEKLQLFFLAIKAKAAAEDAMADPDTAQPHIQTFVIELEKQWQGVREAPKASPHKEASDILREFLVPIEEGMRRGEKELQQRYLAGEDIQEDFLLWWVLYLYRQRSSELAMELGLLTKVEELVVSDPVLPPVIDETALSSFQAAMELVL